MTAEGLHRPPASSRSSLLGMRFGFPPPTLPKRSAPPRFNIKCDLTFVLLGFHSRCPSTALPRLGFSIQMHVYVILVTISSLLLYSHGHC